MRTWLTTALVCLFLLSGGSVVMAQEVRPVPDRAREPVVVKVKKKKPVKLTAARYKNRTPKARVRPRSVRLRAQSRQRSSRAVTSGPRYKNRRRVARPRYGKRRYQ